MKAPPSTHLSPGPAGREALCDHMCVLKTLFWQEYYKFSVYLWIWMYFMYKREQWKVLQKQGGCRYQPWSSEPPVESVAHSLAAHWNHWGYLQNPSVWALLTELLIHLSCGSFKNSWSDSSVLLNLGRAELVTRGPQLHLRQTRHLNLMLERYSHMFQDMKWDPWVLVLEGASLTMSPKARQL